ncbi:RNA polymerase sigma-70 factor, ECF subfamily [Pedobacter steynii]|uniref:RNA polymerase sigma-70 factor, ECF subfamily n=1 Tax=Pedobacter steynii TaxID=430522 RepID=A0A1H0G332_9SPHI|nr:sigma-70 family RNA polymerase sigma factor [Pedobacter steynii]NQX42305.1 sigma-70 family RNA polymerase sigma factor [Pedobacter steynii]SDO01241.1 RNA polymerase sigma-70 factor, ECF subfamily [Pedobacter steynii]
MSIPSEEHFNNMYRTYFQALCFFSLKMVGDVETAKDVVEEVFTKLILSKREFNETDNARAWLYTAVRNASLDYLKQNKHAKERQFEFSLTWKDEGSYDFELVRAEVLRKILVEIKELPGHSGKIIEMSYFEGMKNEDIAATLGLSEKTVRNLKSTGIATLKSKIPLDLFLMFLLLAGSTGR